MRVMVLSANTAGAVYSGGFYRHPEQARGDPRLPIGCADGELLAFDSTLWANPDHIAGHEPARADGGRGRQNIPNGFIVNGARFVAGLRLVMQETDGQPVPVTITGMDSNQRITRYQATTGNGLALTGELFTWGALNSHDSAALHLSLHAHNPGPHTRTVYLGMEQPTPGFEDIYALRGYLGDDGPASQVQAVAGGFDGIGPVYPRLFAQGVPLTATVRDDPWTRFQRISLNDAPWRGDPHRMGQWLTLPAGDEVLLTIAFMASMCPKEQVTTFSAPFTLPFPQAQQELGDSFARFVARQPQFRCESITLADCGRLNHLTRAARQDLWVLQMPYRTENMSEALPVLTAGTPDFRTLFGRDSLIAMLLGRLPRDLCRNIIKAHSANLNATGFIPHELNFGPRINETPFNFVTHMLGQNCQAYDAQNLYLLALNTLWRESGDHDIILSHWQDIQKIRQWNDREISRNGLIAYTLDGPNGLTDKGWMDGGPAIRWPDGSPFALLPKATVELQALFYKGLMTEISWLDTPAIAVALERRGVDVASRQATLQAQADRFCQHFDTVFRDSTQGGYTQAVGWDAGRGVWVQNGVLASNIHYLIGSGLVAGKRLRAIIRQVGDAAHGLFNPAVGLRTVSAHMPFYDPEAYQQGSSWTFDTALAALHLKQQRRMYRRVGDAAGVALCEATLAAFTAALLAVFTRDGSHFAEHLHGDTGAELVSGNTPQLWSIAAWLRTESLLMGLEIDMRHGELHIRPADWMQAFMLRDLPAGAGVVSMRYDTSTTLKVEILENTSGCRILVDEQEAVYDAANTRPPAPCV
jgi:glycogen debranching enzyme